jgi:hypothetical protein
MLNIRKEQMKVFSRCAVQRFEDQMVRYLKSALPRHFIRASGEAPNETQVRKLIADGVARAKGYGIFSERDVASYLEFVLILGPDFERQPEMIWALSILSDEELTGRAKVAFLQQAMPRQNADYRALADSHKR